MDLRLVDAEPTEAERAAIEAALALVQRERDGRGAWWCAGVAENVDGDPGDLEPAGDLRTHHRG
jgi:hypothetical protein